MLETDHRNLLWIEKSEVPIVVRWRVYLQSFVIYVKHIPGTQNKVADWLSRMERYFENETATNHMSEVHSDISLLLHMAVFREPAIVSEDTDLASRPYMGNQDEYGKDKETSGNDPTNESPLGGDISVRTQEGVLVTETDQGRVPQEQLTPEDLLRKVHGGRNLHFGARRTWLLLNKKFPGHKIPYRYVQDFISGCAIWVCHMPERPIGYDG